MAVPYTESTSIVPAATDAALNETLNQHTRPHPLRRRAQPGEIEVVR